MDAAELKKYKETISRQIYAFYGSESGVLFGIPADKKEIVEVIIGLTIEYYLAELKKGSD